MPAQVTWSLPCTMKDICHCHKDALGRMCMHSLPSSAKCNIMPVEKVLSRPLKVRLPCLQEARERERKFPAAVSRDTKSFFFSQPCRSDARDPCHHGSICLKTLSRFKCSLHSRPVLSPPVPAMVGELGGIREKKEEQQPKNDTHNQKPRSLFCSLLHLLFHLQCLPSLCLPRSLSLPAQCSGSQPGLFILPREVSHSPRLRLS